MSFVYPEYIIAENEFYLLWSIDDNSWGFYGYDANLTKMNANNCNIKNMYFYWSYSHDYFKIVIDDYEGVFSKKKNNIYEYSYHSKFNDTDEYLFEKIFKTVVVKEQNDEQIVLNFEDKIDFKLHKINLKYISNVCENTKKLNDLIKKNYEEGVVSRREILVDSRGDY